MKKYPRTRLKIVKSAKEGAPLERYTAPLATKVIVNPNDVRRDARVQLEDSEQVESVAERVQPRVATVRVERPVNPHASVSVEQPGAGLYPTVWANLDDELRRQRLLQGINQARQVEDAARLGDQEQVRQLLGQLLPGEEVDPSVLSALGGIHSRESQVLVALFTQLARAAKRTPAAAAREVHPTAREETADAQAERLERKADERQEDPKAEAADDLRQAKQAAQANPPRVSPVPPPYHSPESELAEELNDLSISDDEEPPRAGGGLRRARGKAPRAKKTAPRKGGGAAPPSPQTTRWEEMRVKQPALFRLTMRSQQKAAPLIKYMSEVGIPVRSMGRGAGRFPTEHLKQAVLDWHEQQQLAGEGVHPDEDDSVPQPFVKKVQRKKPTRPKPAPASSSDDEPDAERWDIVTGLIGAGNNNPELVAEARQIAQRALKKGSLTAAQYAKLDAHLSSRA